MTALWYTYFTNKPFLSLIPERSEISSLKQSTNPSVYKLVERSLQTASSNLNLGKNTSTSVYILLVSMKLNNLEFKLL